MDTTADAATAVTCPTCGAKPTDPCIHTEPARFRHPLVPQLRSLADALEAGIQFGLPAPHIAGIYTNLVPSVHIDSLAGWMQWLHYLVEDGDDWEVELRGNDTQIVLTALAAEDVVLDMVYVATDAEQTAELRRQHAELVTLGVIPDPADKPADEPAF